MLLYPNEKVCELSTLLWVGFVSSGCQQRSFTAVCKILQKCRVSCWNCLHSLWFSVFLSTYDWCGCEAFQK